MKRHRTFVLPILLFLCSVCGLEEAAPLYGKVASRSPQFPPRSKASGNTAVFRPGLASDYRESFVFLERTFPNSHGSSLVELDHGDVLITWFSGSAEAGRDAQVYSVRYFANNGDYSRPSVVVRKGERAEGALWSDKSVGNTALFIDDNNFLWLFYNAVSFGGWSGSMVNYKVSDDMGNHWSQPRRFVGFFGNLVRNVPLRLSQHSFVVPLYIERFRSRSYLCRVQHDRGKILSQSCGGIISENGLIQPTLVQAADGRILMLLRDKSRKGIRRSWSQDQGETWSAIDEIGLPSPNASMAIAALDDRRLLLIYNHSSKDRTPLSIAISGDNGNTFHRIKDLEIGPGDFSYPAIIQTRDSLIHVTYSYNRTTIKHVTVSKEWLDFN